METQTIQSLSSWKQPQTKVFAYLDIKPSKLLEKQLFRCSRAKVLKHLVCFVWLWFKADYQEIGGGKTLIRVVVQNNRFMLGLVSSGCVSNGGCSLLSGGSDLAQISDLGRGKSPEADSKAGGIQKNLSKCKLEIIWDFFTFLHESMDEESLSAEDSASWEIFWPSKPPGRINCQDSLESSLRPG